MTTVLALLDFAGRDLDRVPEAINAALVDCGGFPGSDIELEIVCRSTTDAERVRARGRARPRLINQAVQLRDLVWQQGVDGILDLLGVELPPECHRVLCDECGRASKPYYGPSELISSAALHMERLSPRVISVVSNGKHAGKTLVSTYLFRVLQESGRRVVVYSMERSPAEIDGIPNPKSDFARLRARGIDAQHFIRVGDIFHGLARIYGKRENSKIFDDIIIDNSGASIAPIEPDIVLEIDDWQQRKALQALLLGTRFFTLSPAPSQFNDGQVKYRTAYRVSRIIGELPAEHFPAVALFQYRHFDPISLRGVVPDYPLVSISNTLEDFKSWIAMNRGPNILITDDYLADHFSTLFDAIIVISIEVVSLDIGSLGL